MKIILTILIIFLSTMAPAKDIEIKEKHGYQLQFKFDYQKTTKDKIFDGITSLENNKYMEVHYFDKDIMLESQDGFVFQGLLSIYKIYKKDGLYYFTDSDKIVKPSSTLKDVKNKLNERLLEIDKTKKSKP